VADVVGEDETPAEDASPALDTADKIFTDALLQGVGSYIGGGSSSSSSSSASSSSPSLDVSALDLSFIDKAASAFADFLGKKRRRKRR